MLKTGLSLSQLLIFFFFKFPCHPLINLVEIGPEFRLRKIKFIAQNVLVPGHEPNKTVQSSSSKQESIT